MIESFSDEEDNRLQVFKDLSSVDSGTTKSLLQRLKENGIKFPTGRFTSKENKQLVKNWERLTEDFTLCDKECLLLRKLTPAHLIPQLKSFIKQTFFYSELGRNINRPLYSVYCRAKKLFIPRKMGRYSKKELKKLKYLEEELGPMWEEIGRQMGRDGQSLCKKFTKTKRKNLKNGPWSSCEVKKLEKAVMDKIKNKKKFDNESFNGIKWEEVSMEMETRTGTQCRTKWLSLMYLEINIIKREKNNDNNSDYLGNKEEKNMFDFKDEYYKKYSFDINKKMDLIIIILNQNLNFEEDINWLTLALQMNVDNPLYIKNQWLDMKKNVPNYDLKTLDEILDFLVPFYTEKIINKYDKYQFMKDFDFSKVADFDVENVETNK